MPPKKAGAASTSGPVRIDQSGDAAGVTTLGNAPPPADDLAGSCRLDPGLLKSIC